MNKVIGGREYVKCDLCDKFATLHNAGLLGWDWFTGRLPETVHYCTVHSRSAERDMAYDKAMEMKPIRVRSWARSAGSGGNFRSIEIGQEIGGGIPSEAYAFKAVPHYRNRRTYFTVESNVEVDQTNAGRPRTFSTKAKADNRADALNRERTAHQQASRMD